MTNKSNDNSEVFIFGQKMAVENNYNTYFRDSTSGILLIFIGSILLLNSFNILPWTIWSEILHYWPLLLILFGLKILFGRNIVSRFLMLIINLVIFVSLFLFIISRHSPELITWIPEHLRNYLLIWEVFIQ